ncbi:redoxin domain-containing protein [Methanocella arvoryzae]|uniref:2-cysteine peroxiredoxin n=1 Tax=Methanocella arvoryzae (strain DSM 22066 / NBRC 105507 / MRE50) TaxID=351160 RepID=Q0W202_METAR|nr:redoxin domain-containing protein [Methanocella arvoryzae]CAJ37591.1 putative 2-cysteine peroxiredoxin [Methanocella arvoryzae MRE50]
MVYVVYAADCTYVCPKEFEEMAMYYTNFIDLGAEVFSASRDSAYVHKAWHNSTPQLQAIQYPMLANTTGHISRTFGTFNETDGLLYRATFIVDPDGYVKVIEMHEGTTLQAGDSKVCEGEPVQNQPAQLGARGRDDNTGMSLRSAGKKTMLII